jgi:hypothetical protein
VTTSLGGYIPFYSPIGTSHTLDESGTYLTSNDQRLLVESLRQNPGARALGEWRVFIPRYPEHTDFSLTFPPENYVDNRHYPDGTYGVDRSQAEKIYRMFTHDHLMYRLSWCYPSQDNWKNKTRYRNYSKAELVRKLVGHPEGLVFIEEEKNLLLNWEWHNHKRFIRKWLYGDRRRSDENLKRFTSWNVTN